MQIDQVGSLPEAGFVKALVWRAMAIFRPTWRNRLIWRHRVLRAYRGVIWRIKCAWWSATRKKGAPIERVDIGALYREHKYPYDPFAVAEAVALKIRTGRTPGKPMEDPCLK